MSSRDFKKQFAKYGYILVPGVISKSEVSRLRKLLETKFPTRRDTPKRMLLPSEVIQIPELSSLALFPPIVEALKQIVGEPFAMLANFAVQRNLFGGWHTDAASEGNAAYLLDPSYRYVKCGLFLQDNSDDWGGGIDVVPGGQRYPFRLPDLDTTSRVKRIWNRIGQRFFSQSLKISAGDFVAFDYRLPHRATWPMKKNRGDIVDEVMLNIPSDRTKLVLYWDAGSPQRAGKYLQHAARRAQNEELTGRALDPFFSDYLRLRFPESYPPGFVDTVRQCGVQIATLDRDLAREWHDKFTHLMSYGSPKS